MLLGLIGKKTADVTPRIRKAGYRAYGARFGCAFLASEGPAIVRAMAWGPPSESASPAYLIYFFDFHFGSPMETEGSEALKASVTRDVRRRLTHN